MKRCARHLVAASAILLGTGCYGYRTVAPGSVTPGATVRVTLSAEEAVRQQQGLGGLRQQVEGEVVPLETTSSLGLTIPLREGSPADRPGFNTFIDYYSQWARTDPASAPKYRAISGTGSVDEITARAFQALAA